jgi:hypothetical protein
MRKFFLVLAVVSVALVPIGTHAATFSAQQSYISGSSQRVSGNIFLAVGNASVGAAVAGDVSIAGGNISITGPVDGTITALAGSLQVLSPVAGDVRVAGGEVSIGQSVGGDVVAAAGTITILPDAVVDGDLYVAGGQVVVDGTVHGSIVGRVKQLTINGTVSGTTTVTSANAPIIGAGAHVGTVLYHSTSHISLPDHAASPSEFIWGLIALATALRTLAYLGAVVALVAWWRRPTLNILNETADRFWHWTGHGLLYAFVVPIAGILLAISFVGTLIGVVVLGVYVLAAVVAKVLAGVLLGSWLDKKVSKKPAMRLTYGTAICGTILFMLATLIPIFGWILQAVLFFAVFGLIAHRLHEGVIAR